MIQKAGMRVDPSAPASDDFFTWKGGRYRVVDAQAAVPGRDYICLCCGARMHHVKSSLGTDFFRCHRGQVHTSPACLALAKSSVIRDATRLRKARFFEKLYQPISGPHAPQEARSAGMAPSTSTGERFCAPSSIKDLLTLGADRWPPDSPIADGLTISDIYLPYRLYHTYMEAAPVLGDRMIDARPLYAYDGEITLSIFWTRQNGTRARRIFVLSTGDAALYQQAVELLFHVGGRFSPYRRYTSVKASDVVVAARWSTLTPEACHAHCSMCAHATRYVCLGAMRGYLTSMKQLYVYGDDHQAEAVLDDGGSF